MRQPPALIWRFERSAVVALLALLVLAAQAAAPQRAHAFSDPLSFGDGVDIGGGGGRYFTGSVADGYGCDVCHRGAEGAPVKILGLPLAGYQPGASYEVRVEWPSALQHIGLALEITDAVGRQAGSLRLPPDNELTDPELCEPIEDHLIAAVLNPLDSGRTILNVPDCGSKRVRFLWTAPSTAEGTVRLSGGLVVSDAQADAEGDGTTMFSRELAPLGGSPALASDIRTGCNLTQAEGSGTGRAWPLVLAFGAGLLWRRRRPTRRR